MPDVATVVQRSVLVDSIQWSSQDQAAALAEWSGGRYDRHVSGALGPDGQDWGELTVHTHGGILTVCPFDYLVHTVTGEFHPFTADAYHATFAA